MVYVIQYYRQLSCRIRMELQFHPDPARKLSTNLYDIYHCCVYSKKKKTPDDGKRNCPKHVEFPSKNKFEKLMHLVGFIIRHSHVAGRGTTVDLTSFTDTNLIHNFFI